MKNLINKIGVNVLLFVIGVIIISISVFYFIEKIKNNKLEQIKSTLELEVNYANNNLQKFKDDAGFYRAKAQSAETNLKSFKEVYSKEIKTLNKEFSDLKKNYKNLRGLYKISLETNKKLTLKLDSIPNDTTYNDNGTIENIVYNREFNYSDKWSNINGKIGVNSNFINDDYIFLEYTVRDSITFISYFKKTGGLFSNKKDLYIEGKSHNKNTQINGIREVIINNVDIPTWSIGFQAGYGVTENGLGWYAGLGVSKTIIRW